MPSPHEYLKRESRVRPLQTTALVHEAYLRLAEHDVSCRDRTHFVAVAATTMRRVLVDLARERSSRKRGSQCHSSAARRRSSRRGSFDPRRASAGSADGAPHGARRAQGPGRGVAGLRGLTVDEAAEALGISRATLERDFRFAKAWLGRELLQTPAT